MSSIPDLLVVGTDTGVGKSVISLLLMRLLFECHCDPVYLKPFQTGCRDPYDTDSDAAFVYRHTPALRDCDPADAVVCCYPEPKAPLFAARDAGEHIDLDYVLGRIAHHRGQARPLVVEAAGGLMVPVTDDRLIIDLIGPLNCRPLLVARAGLGTINHTLLSLQALRQINAPPIGVVMVAGSPAVIESDLIAENMAAVADFGKVPVGGMVPYIEDFNAPPSDADRALRRLLLPAISS